MASEVLQIFQRVLSNLLAHSVDGSSLFDPGVVQGIKGADSLRWIVRKELGHEVLRLVTH